MGQIFLINKPASALSALLVQSSYDEHSPHLHTDTLSFRNLVLLNKINIREYSIVKCSFLG